MASIDIEHLAEQIAKGLEEYSSDVVEKVNEGIDEVSKKGLERLKELSPKHKGKYAKGWRIKTQNFIGECKNSTLYNQKVYMLTHLLENGHAKQNGGRTRKFPHIKKVEDEVIETLERKVVSALGG